MTKERSLAKLRQVWFVSYHIQPHYMIDPNAFKMRPGHKKLLKIVKKGLKYLLCLRSDVSGVGFQHWPSLLIQMMVTVNARNDAADDMVILA